MGRRRSSPSPDGIESAIQHRAVRPTPSDRTELRSAWMVRASGAFLRDHRRQRRFTAQSAGRFSQLTRAQHIRSWTPAGRTRRAGRFGLGCAADGGQPWIHARRGNFLGRRHGADVPVADRPGPPRGDRNRCRPQLRPHALDRGIHGASLGRHGPSRRIRDQLEKPTSSGTLGPLARSEVDRADIRSPTRAHLSPRRRRFGLVAAQSSASGLR